LKHRTRYLKAQPVDEEPLLLNYLINTYYT